MNLFIMVGIICVGLMILFNLKAIKWLPKAITKIAIGALLLFFLNILSGSFGLHVPINLFTATTVGFLGIPGMIALSSLHLFFI
ncbi:pro-sigmaK processing inhibitor BofA family protein [Amphibacillus sp. Q70]|uniref:pro-sigmaK processing inhibitor BofA family protein n=1 Tax=Amphibacillus sp. Q70 TaxID=3453416 RepID=UPI003F83F0A6